MRKLGFEILREDTTIVDRELYANATNISAATYNILSEWFKTQQHPTKAYEDLVQSLGEVRLNLLIEDLKGIVEGKKKKQPVTWVNITKNIIEKH